MSDRPDAAWDYSVLNNAVIKNDQALKGEKTRLFSNEKKYRGFNVIGRDKKINGGVQMTTDGITHVCEAVVVDGENEELDFAYKNVISAIETYCAKEGKDFKEEALDIAYSFVLWKMPYNEDIVDNIQGAYGSGSLVNLSLYVREEAGVCRHQALLLGYIIERMIEEKRLGGKVSVDRSYQEDLGGHQWVRYTSKSGEIFILDPALHKIGRLREMNLISIWDYRRPDEKK